jgi:hypothetical protein
MPEQTNTRDEADRPTAMQVFGAWELLRLVYNLTLVLVVVFWVFFSGHGLHPRVVFSLPKEAVVANLCFCAGPVLEGYLFLIGVPRRRARWGLFIIGTLLTVAEAVWDMDRLVALGA